MEKQDLIELVKDHLAAFCAGDWTSHQAGLTPDAMSIEKATGRVAEGAERYIAAVKGWVEAFPDMSVTYHSLLVDGNTVVAEITWEGTQTGPLKGPTGIIAPSFKHGTLDAVQIITFRGDKVKEVHQYFDLMALLRQLGAMPMPASLAVG